MSIHSASDSEKFFDENLITSEFSLSPDRILELFGKESSLEIQILKNIYSPGDENPGKIF